QLGAKLFQRTPSGSVLTSAGAKLVERAERIEALILDAREAIVDRDSSVSGTIRIGAPEVVGAMLLAPRLARLSKIHKGLAVQLAAMPHNFSLTKRETDMIIGLTPPDHARLVSRKLANYYLCAYASREYIAQAPDIRTMEDLYDHPLISYTDELVFSSYFDYLRIVLPYAVASFQSSSLIAQLNATVEGLGICILPHFMTRAHAELLPILPTLTTIRRSWYVIYNEEQRSLARIRAVSDFLSAEFKALRPLLTGEEPTAGIYAR
ncbi:LysR family transcriptional regulator, partial [Methylobacterium trifolii]|uniref:LysR family transcriptional regulator n=1 Tax=Methylobacterium trifolii TaxID=1003092 RepID=UPI001EDCF4E9